MIDDGSGVGEGGFRQVRSDLRGAFRLRSRRRLSMGLYLFHSSHLHQTLRICGSLQPQ